MYMQVCEQGKNKILHITPHLGGGVGRVLLNYISKVKNCSSFEHKVTCLDYANDNAIEAAKNVSFFLIDNMVNKKQELLNMVTEADIVLIHWWNHPLLYDFLVRTELPPCRVIIWSHISGLHPPYIFTDKILNYPDLFVFTTPVSYEAKEVQILSDEQKKFLRVVWSTGGVEHVKSVILQAHSGFNVGYIGTVDYCKIHPDFLNICNRVNIPKIKFIVCGGASEKEIMEEAEGFGIGEKFNFTGLISDITEYLSIFDIFGYPLASYHYGTCDQVLAESMAAGIVPVVLSNMMESYMVKDGKTGIVAKDENEYIEALQTLYFDEDLRYSLSRNAKDYALKAFSLDTMILEWEKVFKEALTLTKTIKKWEINKISSDISATEVFLESLGCYGEDFVFYCNAESDEEKRKAIEKIKKLAQTTIWQAKTKGTVYHYNYFFPNDRYLSVWSQLIKESKSYKKEEV